MLDVLRAFAVLLVVLSHIWELVPGWPLRRLLSGSGFLGVDLFFVLSGFLITALLLQEQRDHGRIDLARFYLRRALRLLPALVTLLAVYLVYSGFAGWPPLGIASKAVDSVRAILLYAMNWRVLRDPLGSGDLTALWSLSIEEQFYVVWPLALITFLSVQRRVGSVVAALVVGIVTVSVWRAYVYHRWGWQSAYLRTDTRVDGLLVGALLGTLFIRGRTPAALPRWTPYAVMAVWAVLLVTTTADGWWAYHGGITLWVLATGAIVVYAASDPRPLVNPIMRAGAAVGAVSYGIYLWQLPVIKASGRWGESWSGMSRMALATVLLTACVIASWLLVERPALRLKRRAVSRRPRPSAEPAEQPTGDAV